MSHTPTPWKWWTSNSFKRLSSEVTGKDGDVLYASSRHDSWSTINVSDDDAEFIVRACNVHDEMLHLFEWIYKHKGECPADNPVLITKMKRVIAQAKGEA